MGDGKALQMGTSHELGQNFARVFEIDYLDSDGRQQLCWTTSWGTSTRMIGGLIMGRGDDAGLVVPPRVAPIQCAIVVVKEESGAGDAARRIATELSGRGVRARIDDRVGTGFGRRATDWEIKGVPTRIEVGPRDLANGEVTLVRRDTGVKTQVPVDESASRVIETLDAQQVDLLRRALDRREERTTDCDTLEQAGEAAQTGFARVPWAVIGTDGEARLNADGVTVRCLQREDGALPLSDDEPDLVAYVARAY